MKISDKFGQFYSQKKCTNLYPTEFVIRTFLGKYPYLNIHERSYAQKKILDLGFGDGRNLEFLCKLGFNVYGVETSNQIIDLALQFTDKKQLSIDLRVGHNASIPFENGEFDFLLACHSCYYLAGDDCFEKNLAEMARVMKSGATMVASFPTTGNFILDSSNLQYGNYAEIIDDPYGLRNGCRIKYFTSKDEIKECLAPYFKNFSYAVTDDDYFGIRVRAYIVVCERL